MKNIRILLFIILLLVCAKVTDAQVAINTDGSIAASSSVLDVTSTSKGVLIPRMTKTNRDAISSPATGLLIYQTDNTPGFYFYNGSAWVVIGAEAVSINDLSDAASDANSVFLGSGSGANDDGTANQNTGVGVSSLNGVTDGYENTAIGKESLQTLTTGDHNAAFGIHALQVLVTGNDNTALGTNAGIATTGSGNILIGSNAAYFATGINNQLYIENSASTSPLIYGEFDNDLVRINGDFEVTGSMGGVNNLSDGKTGGFSVFLGSNAGANDDGTDNWNSVVGNSAFNTNTSGSYNTVIGDRAMYTNGTGEGSVALGHKALYSNSTGSKSIAIGFEAGYSETGSNTLYIENSSSTTPLIYGEFDNDLLRVYGTLDINNAYQFPTAAGTNGQLLKTDGSGILSWADDTNTGATDINDLSDAKTDASNVFLGIYAGEDDDGNNFATAVGIGAMADNTTGNKNTAVGSYSLDLNTTGGSNTAVGSDALKSNTTASNNTAVGLEALLNNSTGHHNTSIGRSALTVNTTGSYNTAIGADAGPSTGNNNLENTGSFGYDSHVTASNYYRFGNGNVVSIGGKVEWSAWSDKRFKKNIKADVPGLDFVLKLQPVIYNWDIQKLNEFVGSTKSNEQPDEERQKAESIVYTGFLAQDVEKVAKQIGYDFSGVETPPNDGTPYSLRYAEFVVPLVKAVQEQQEMIELLKEQNKALWKEIEELKKK